MGYVLTDMSVTIGGTTVSSFVRSGDVQMSVEDVDLTAMGATSRNHGAGLRDDRLTLECFSDYTSVTGLDAVLNPLLGSSTGATIVVKPTSSAASSTNPSYTMVGVLFDYHPIQGEVGAAAMTPVTFLPAAGSKWTRATA
jgi:hypothetical protein